MKKIIGLLIAFNLIVCVGLIVHANESSTPLTKQDEGQKIKVLLDNKEYNPDTPLEIIDDAVWVPLREFVEGLGGEVIWDNKNRQVNIICCQNKKKKAIALPVDLPYGGICDIENYRMVVYNDECYPKIINGRVFLPVGGIVELLGGRIEIDNDANTVFIKEIPEINNDEYLEILNRDDYKMIGITIEEFRKKIGEPEKIDEKYDDENINKIKVLYYKFGKVKFSYNEYLQKDLLYSFEINNEILSGPRDIKVGDDVNTVLSKFPDYDHFIENNRRTLYKSIIYNDLGEVIYDDKGKINEVRFENKIPNIYLVFEISNDKVSKTEIYTNELYFLDELNKLNKINSEENIIEE